MPNENERLLRKRLLIARELRRLSQTAVASRAGLRSSAVGCFETGDRSPSFEDLTCLADALEVTTDYLLGRIEQPKTSQKSASGPDVDQLLRRTSKLSRDDLEILIGFADMLVRRTERRQVE